MGRDGLFLVLRAAGALAENAATMLRPLRPLLTLWFVSGFTFAAQSQDSLMRDALAAEARLDTRGALALFLDADRARPNDAFILQKIARQYSDLVLDAATDAEKRAVLERALDYSRRAEALEPRNPVNVLSVAISHAKLALLGNPVDRVRHSRLVQVYAVRALALDPDYAWAHHVLGRWHNEVATLGATSRTVVKLFLGGLPPASVAEAVAHLERAVALEPGELQHHLELGFAYLTKADVAQARASFARGLAMPSRARIDDPAKARARAALKKLGSR